MIVVFCNVLVTYLVVRLIALIDLHNERNTVHYSVHTNDNPQHGGVSLEAAEALVLSRGQVTL
jgi:hypothetical protein